MQLSPTKIKSMLPSGARWKYQNYKFKCDLWLVCASVDEQRHSVWHKSAQCWSSSRLRAVLLRNCSSHLSCESNLLLTSVYVNEPRGSNVLFTPGFMFTAATADGLLIGSQDCSSTLTTPVLKCDINRTITRPSNIHAALKCHECVKHRNKRF